MQMISKAAIFHPGNWILLSGDHSSFLKFLRPLDSRTTQSLVASHPIIHVTGLLCVAMLYRLKSIWLSFMNHFATLLPVENLIPKSKGGQFKKELWYIPLISLNHLKWPYWENLNITFLHVKFSWTGQTAIPWKQWKLGKGHRKRLTPPSLHMPRFLFESCPCVPGNCVLRIEVARTVW